VSYVNSISCTFLEFSLVLMGCIVIDLIISKRNYKDVKNTTIMKKHNNNVKTRKI